MSEPVESQCQSSSGVSFGERIHHHESLTAIALAIKQGCPLCSWFADLQPAHAWPQLRANVPAEHLEEYEHLVQGLEAQEQHISLPNNQQIKFDCTVEIMMCQSISQKNSYRAFSLELLERYGDAWFGQCILVPVDHDKSEDYCPNSILFAYTMTDFEDRLNFPGYNPTDNTSSISCFELAKSWLRTCHQDHGACRRSSAGKWKPTRLIEIRDKGQKLRIVEAESMPAELSYISLSHCWGLIPDKIVLTVKNLKDWKRSIPALTGFKTFLDAIEITCAFGIDYLWIDSLCIIQDSREDWIHESALMCEVYENSYLNIAAAKACDDTEGCFVSRDISDIVPARLHFGKSELESLEPLQSRSRGSSDAVFRCKTRTAGENPLRGDYEFQKYRFWKESIVDSRLNSRAWVVQERILSPRNLHYGPDQIYWECNELNACETSPYGIISDDRYDRLHYRAILAKTLDLQSENKTADENPGTDTRTAAGLEAWAQVVNTFTRASLTKSGDKLIAISAVARKLKGVIQGRYLAGHWEKQLLEELNWSGANRSTRPAEYRCPSWSWASVDAEIHLPAWYTGWDYQSELDMYLAEILDVRIDQESDDEMGPVKGGYIRLQGQLIELEIKFNECTWADKHWQDTQDRQIVTINGIRTTLFLQDDDEAKPSVVTGSRLYCLPLIVLPYFGALILKKVKDVDVPLFHRVGYTRTKRDLKNYDSFETDGLLRLIGHFEQQDNGSSVFTRALYNSKDITVV